MSTITDKREAMRLLAGLENGAMSTADAFGLAETLGRALKAQANDLPANVKCYLLIGTYLSQYYFGRIHGKAQNLLPSLRAGYDSALEEVDILAMPTSPIRPFKYDPEMDWKSKILRDYSIPDNCGPFNATGQPQY